jgi:hypothetical protein
VILTFGLCCGVLFSWIARAREGSAKIPAAGRAAAPPFNIDLRVYRFIAEFLSWSVFGAVNGGFRRERAFCIYDCCKRQVQLLFTRSCTENRR